MKITALDKLKNRLNSLTVFREILKTRPVSAFVEYIDALGSESPEKCVERYSEFVYELYSFCGGNISAMVKELCYASENAYVKDIGKGNIPPECIKQAVDSDLLVLQRIADLTFEDVTEPISFMGGLSPFITENTDIIAGYAARTADIGRYGYGKYAKNPMFFIEENGEIVPVRNPDNITLDSLVGYKEERKLVIDNTKALLMGKPAANALLTGDAGTGKSSTVKAVENAFFDEGLRLIEMRKSQLFLLPRVLDELADNPLKFIIFIDDISFVKDDDCFNALKAVLEGSVSARSKNVVVYATSNRRHIVKEKFSDREGDDIHINDTLQETVSLSERFGLQVTFRRPDKKVYLDIVFRLAADGGIEISGDELELKAERFALSHGGRSPRHARQFIDALISGTF